MVYAPNIYKRTLDNYLTSGIKYLRYMRKRIDNAMIFYPIINDMQIKSFVVDQICKDGKSTSYDKSKPYSDWNWFVSQFDIIGLEELDGSIKASYFVLIVGTKAALIKLTSQNYELDRLNDKSVYDIQSYFLLKSSKRIARSGNHFYRYDYAHGRFEYGNRRLPFQQMVRLATDITYTSDNLFIDYLLTINLDEVDLLLNKLLSRYIRGCKGSDTKVSKSDWLNHTNLVFSNKVYRTEQEEIIGKRVIMFCEAQSNTSTKQSSNQITAHYSTINGNYKQDFFEKLYDILTSEGYIDTLTTKSDFIFFFMGKGDYPSDKIKWLGSKVSLAILIAKLHSQTTTDWKTTEAIFDNVKGDNLKKQYNNTQSDSKSERVISQLIDRAK